MVHDGKKCVRSWVTKRKQHHVVVSKLYLLLNWLRERLAISRVRFIVLGNPQCFAVARNFHQPELIHKVDFCFLGSGQVEAITFELEWKELKMKFAKDSINCLAERSAQE